MRERAPPSTSGPAAALQRRLPGRREHPGLARATRAGDHEQAWRRSSPTIRSRRSTDESATTRARAPATGASSTARSRSTRSSGSSGISPLERGWRFDPPPAPSGKRVLVIGAGPSGLSAAYHLTRLGHEVEIRDAGAEPGGMMRYGIPAYRLPRAVLDGEIARIAGARRAPRLRPPGGRPRGRADRGRVRRGVRRGRRASLEAGRDSGTRCRPRSSTRCRSCAGWRPASGRRSGAGSLSTAAATPRWTRRVSPAASAPRRR